MNAFQRKDLAELLALFTIDVTLQDSFTPRLSGRDHVLHAYRTMFEGSTCRLTLLRRFRSEWDEEAQEFRLVVTDAAGGETLVEGIDVFKFRDGLICDIRAYVEARKLSPERS